MNATKKQHIKRSMQDTVRHLAEAIESMKAAADIIQEEMEQLYIGRLLTHKKGASPEMFDLGEDKRRLKSWEERLNTYMKVLNKIANKYE